MPCSFPNVINSFHELSYFAVWAWKWLPPQGIEPWIFGLRDRRLTTWPQRLLVTVIPTVIQTFMVKGLTMTSMFSLHEKPSPWACIQHNQSTVQYFIAFDLIFSEEVCSRWGYSSVAEHSTADREVPGSIPGVPFFFYVWKAHTLSNVISKSVFQHLDCMCARVEPGKLPGREFPGKTEFFRETGSREIWSGNPGFSGCDS